MRLFLLIVTLLFCFVLASGQPESNEVYVGTVALRLNMPQRVAIAELSRTYRLVEEQGAWSVWPGTGHGAVVGRVRFAEGKLSFVSNNLYTRVAGDPNFPSTLHRSVENLVKGGNNACLVSTGSKGKGKEVFVTCGDRTLRITTAILNTGAEIVFIDDQVGSYE